MARITVAVTQREVFGYTRRSLDSLYANPGLPFDLVYVDAGSPRAIRDLIAAQALRYGFRVLRYERFLGHNEARNLALGASRGEYLVLVDNDVVFGERWLERLVHCADETGAEAVGPLICQGNPPFKKVHLAGGEARIEDGPAGRRLHESMRFVGRPVADVAPRLVREPVSMLETHCMLLRRTLFDRLGPLDERFCGGQDHIDFSFSARAAGATLMFEPSSVVSQLLPAPFPRDLQSLPFFYTCWNRQRNRADFEYFRTKWKLAPDDPALVSALNFCNDRPDILFPYLRLHLLRYGLRKLRRIATGAAARRGATGVRNGQIGSGSVGRDGRAV
jgi:GT2 family glycosyltransferase